MKKEIEEIREALESINANDEETEAALESLEEAIDEIDRHPAVGAVRTVVSETASEIRGTVDGGGGDSGSALSARWRALQEHLEEWEDEHPTPVMVVGKVARALAVLGI